MRSLFLAICLFLASTAHAGVVTMVFSASGFGTGAPTDPVNGTLTWSAASQTAPIDQLLSINLTIDGHAYGLAEIGFDGFVIGGLPSGISSVVALANADDFLFSVNPVSEALNIFAFSVQGVTDQIWISSNNTADFRFDDTGIVPEPGSFALVGLAVAGLAAVRRRKP